MSPVDRGHTRRAFLATAALGTLAACSGSERAIRPAIRATTPAPSAGPLPVPWKPSRGDLEPAAKLAAVRHIERLDRGAQVIDAQYGGLLTVSASVLVVTDNRTFDVRLIRRGSSWSVIAVHPSEPGPPVRRPSSVARRVLAHHRIALPQAARADVAAGQVHDTVLEAMLQVAARWTIGVSVVRSGHPLYVFGTNRLSDHPRGRAFDTWQIDGEAIVAPGTSRRLVTSYMETLAELGSSNVGGPILLGAAPQFFSDRTHHDHVHAGFSR
ncbi:MAG: hypothetical protein ACTHOG_03025 [Marmoricola sp.]